MVMGRERASDNNKLTDIYNITQVPKSQAKALSQ